MMALLLVIAMLSTILLTPAASAAGGVVLTAADKNDLAAKYAPTMYFHGGEEVYPVNVTYFISSSNLNESVNDVAVLLNAAPNTTSLGDYSNSARNFYLDDRLGNINDRRIIDAYKKNESTLGYTVYAHVTANATNIAVQYWFFYVFNAGTYNAHEGDWEMIEVVLDSNRTPVSTAYSQHEEGQKAAWSDVEKSGNGPIVYVAKGSHANYYRAYQGMMGAAQDEVGSNGKVLRPLDYSLVVLGEKGAGNHPASQNWLDYTGRWGDWGNQTSDMMGQRGPLGPGYRMDGQMWSGLAWADTRAALDQNQLLIEMLLSNLPFIMLALLIIPIALMVRRVVKKRRTGELRPPFIYLLDIRGKDLRSIGNLLAVIGLVLGLVAAFLPFYEASVYAKTGPYATDGYERVLLIDGISGIHVNTLDANAGVVQVGAFPIPIWMFIVVSILAFIISTVAREPRKAGRKYIAHGIEFMVPLIVMILIIGSIGSLAGSSDGPGGDDSIRTVLKTISANPLGGEKLVPTSDFGSVSLRWGIGVGAYLFVLAGAILVVAGVLQFASRKDERLSNVPAPTEPVLVQQPIQQYAPGNDGTVAMPPSGAGQENAPN